MIFTPKIGIDVALVAELEPGWDAPVVTNLAVEEHGITTTAPLSQRQNSNTFGNTVDIWRRKCGIPRPSSAARASVSAAMVCRTLAVMGKWNPARLGVVSASTSSAAWTAVTFETRGLIEGWQAVDPLLLPSTLPSALSTQVAMALGARGFALSCVVGLLGVFHAIEAAILGLTRRDADVVLVVASEEQTPAQHRAHEMLGWVPTPGEFAGALAFERETTRGYRVRFLCYEEESCDYQSIPPDWQQAPRFQWKAPHPGPSMQSGEAFRMISSALRTRLPRVVVSGVVPGLGSAVAGFELV